MRQHLKSLRRATTTASILGLGPAYVLKRQWDQLDEEIHYKQFFTHQTHFFFQWRFFVTKCAVCVILLCVKTVNCWLPVLMILHFQLHVKSHTAHYVVFCFFFL